MATTTNNRLDRLEAATGPGKLTGWGDNWGALGLLITQGFGGFYWAGHYHEQNNRRAFDEYLQELHAIEPQFGAHRDGLPLTDSQLDWAWWAVGEELPEWKGSDWWADKAKLHIDPAGWLADLYRDAIFELEAGHLRVWVSCFGNWWVSANARQRATDDYDEKAAVSVAKKLMSAIRLYRHETGDTGPHDLGELRTWLDDHLAPLRGY